MFVGRRVSATCAKLFIQRTSCMLATCKIYCVLAYTMAPVDLSDPPLSRWLEALLLFGAQAGLLKLLDIVHAAHLSQETSLPHFSGCFVPCMSGCLGYIQSSSSSCKMATGPTSLLLLCGLALSPSKYRSQVGARHLSVVDALSFQAIHSSFAIRAGVYRKFSKATPKSPSFRLSCAFSGNALWP